MRGLRVALLPGLCGLALIACTRLITEDLPTTPAGPGGPAVPLPVPTTRPGATPTPRASSTPSPSPGSTPVPTPTPTVLPTPTPPPTPPPAATPDPRTTECVPAPPPLSRINVKVHNDQGEKKVIDSAPNVCSGGEGFEKFCETLMNDPSRRCCPPRVEGTPQRTACDELLMGRAADTGRAGPTWKMNGKPCVDGSSSAVPRCVNHPDNQFLLFIYGKGTVEACAANGFCGSITIN